MFIHAQLDSENVCIGHGDLAGIEDVPSLVYLPNGWEEDLMWRKFVNGAWSNEKFEPIPSNEPTEIDLLKADNDLLKQRSTQNSADLQGFMDYYFSINPE